MLKYTSKILNSVQYVLNTDTEKKTWFLFKNAQYIKKNQACCQYFSTKPLLANHVSCWFIPPDVLTSCISLFLHVYLFILFYTCAHVPRTFIHVRISQFSKWSCSWWQTKIKHCRINNLSFGILKHFHVYCVWFSLDLDWNVGRLSHKHNCCTYWNLKKDKNQMEAEITGREINAEAADWDKIQSKMKRS